MLLRAIISIITCMLMIVSFTLVKNRIESCFGDICRWMNRNDLKLNEHKTELVLISSKFRDGPSLYYVNIASEMKGFPYLIKPQALG